MLGHFIASGYAAEGALAAGETAGATGRAHMEVLYLLPVVCTATDIAQLQSLTHGLHQLLCLRLVYMNDN